MVIPALLTTLIAICLSLIMTIAGLYIGRDTDWPSLRIGVIISLVSAGLIAFPISYVYFRLMLRLEESRVEREVLLREIHHRVKNNLQVMSSLLSLQAGYVEDSQYLGMFDDAANRIRAMAFVHEKLHRSQSLRIIQAHEYVEDLVNGLRSSYQMRPGDIEWDVYIEKIGLTIDTAVPLGLIITESVSNSVKHAFPEGREGKIRVSFRLVGENEFELEIGDNGVGLPEDLDFDAVESLGLRLVNILAEQLKAKIDLDRKEGTELRIRFPDVRGHKGR